MITLTLERRQAFLSSFSVSTTGCWLWTGTMHHRGYGVFWPSIGRKQVSAHRMMYMLSYGEIPRGKQVQHTCDTSACVNPTHLKLGTPQDNMDDMKERGRHISGSHLHPERQPRGEQNGNARWTADVVQEVRRLYAEGATQTRISGALGVPQSTVSAMIRRASWKHV